MDGERVLDLRKFVAPEFVFGAGAARLAGRYALNLGARRALLVTDPALVETGWVELVRSSLEEAGVSAAVFSDASSNPRDSEVMLGAEVYRRERCDAIVAVGGGSPMDLAKGVGVVCSSGRHILEFEGVDRVETPGPPLLCIPTTAGSSADVSQFAIITDSVRKVKIAIVSKTMVPDAALIDPVLTTTLGPGLTACTGLDALTHAFEAYVSNASSPITDLFALSAVRRISGHLLRAMEAPDDLEARGQLSQGCLEAGLAFTNAILGAVHAMAHSLGGSLDLPHGECNAILLRHVVAFNYSAAPERYRKLAEAMGAELAGLDDKAARRETLAAVDRLTAAAGMSRRLADMGVRPQDIPALAAMAMRDPCLITNPRRAEQADLERIYAEAL